MYKIINRYSKSEYPERYTSYQDAELVLEQKIDEYYSELGTQNHYRPYTIVEENAVWLFNYVSNQWGWSTLI